MAASETATKACENTLLSEFAEAPKSRNTYQSDKIDRKDCSPFCARNALFIGRLVARNWHNRLAQNSPLNLPGVT